MRKSRTTSSTDLKQIMSLVSFQHGINPWWGVTVRYSCVVDKIMFSSKDLAEGWLAEHGFKKPYKWAKSDQDLYLRYSRGDIVERKPV